MTVRSSASLISGAIAATLQAALAALAAYIRCVRTGEGARIEVSEGDGAVSCTFDRLFYHLNLPPEEAEREQGSATRYHYYPTKDDKVVMFQPIEEKFWRNFCEAVGRMDLIDRKERTAAPESNLGDEWERQGAGLNHADKDESGVDRVLRQAQYTRCSSEYDR